MKPGDRVTVRSVSTRGDHSSNMIGKTGTVIEIFHSCDHYDGWVVVNFPGWGRGHKGFGVQIDQYDAYAVPPEDLTSEADVVEKILEQYDV